MSDTPTATGIGESGTGNGSGPALPRFRLLLEAPKEGGQSLVLRAFDRELERVVAVKRLKVDFENDPQAIRRFVHEAKETARLNHPGVVPIYCLGVFSNGRPYYAMRYVNGQTLTAHVDAVFREAAPTRGCRSRLRIFGRKASAAVAGPDPDWVRSTILRFRDVCLAVAYAHNQHILHRDLKPDNIMVGDFGETVVIDWGIAKRFEFDRPTIPDPQADGASFRLDPTQLERMTRTGEIKGTLAFMAPEQLTNGKVDERTDVYGLGATLYYVLCGRVPHELPGHTPSNLTEGFFERVRELIDRIVRAEFVPPGRRVDDVDSQLEAICLKAMSRQPEHRYQTVNAMLEDVERWLRWEPVTARRERFREWMARLDQRHRGRLVALSLFLAVTSGLGWSLYLTDRSRRVVVQAMQTEVTRSDLVQGKFDRLIALGVGGLLDQPREALREEFLHSVEDYLESVWKGRAAVADARGAHILIDAAYYRARLNDLRGPRSRAIGVYREAIETLDALQQRGLFNPDDRRIMAELHHGLGIALEEEYALDEADGQYLAARSIREGLMAEAERVEDDSGHADRLAGTLADLARSDGYRGGLLFRTSRPEEAIRSYLSSFHERARIVRELRPENPIARLQLARGLSNLAYVVFEAGDPQLRRHSERLFQAARAQIEPYRSNSPGCPTDHLVDAGLVTADFHLDLANYVNWLGRIALLDGHPEAAVRDHEDAATLLRVAVKNNEQIDRLKLGLAQTDLYLARALTSARRSPTDALSEAERMFLVLANKPGKDGRPVPPDVSTSFGLACVARDRADIEREPAARGRGLEAAFRAQIIALDGSPEGPSHVDTRDPERLYEILRTLEALGDAGQGRAAWYRDRISGQRRSIREAIERTPLDVQHLLDSLPTTPPTPGSHPDRGMSAVPQTRAH